MNNFEIIAMLNQLASTARYSMFWITPYKTGNLALNGYSDVTTLLDSNWGYAVGFRLFERKGVEYGAILNELPVINYRLTNQRTGRVYEGSYVNRHYKWVDTFFDVFSFQIPMYAPVRRIS